MTRKEFIRLCTILGVGAPFQFGFSACGKNNKVKFKGKALIIGAGAGGLSAGYLLQQQGVDFEILEASAAYGGRIKINTDFADFPIPLGAEWLETNTGIFEEIVNDDSVEVDVETIRDAPDRKFVNSSWYNFYDTYIVPSIKSNIRYNSVVKSIDYSSKKEVVVTTQSGTHKADVVIVSVPLKILQDGDIAFSPALPQEKANAIANTTIWDGFKAFIEFSDHFYGEGYQFDISPETDGQKIYYDAAYGQNTNKNILGLFVVGKPVADYSNLSDSELKDFMLAELDGIYSGQATASYIKHISQNWVKEPFIRSGYMTDHANWKTVEKLGKPIDDKVYFAGGPYTDGNDWVSVHAAAQSARMATDRILY